MFSSRTMNVHLGLTISYLPGHLSFSHPGIATSLLHTATGISISAGRLSFARSYGAEAVAFAVPGHAFASSFSTS